MLVELSYVINEKDPIFPGNPPTKRAAVNTISGGDTSNTSQITLFSHNGTHMDAPYHFNSKGLPIDELPPSYFFYKDPFLLNIRKKAHEYILKGDLLKHKELLEKADILLINTGFSKHRKADPNKYLTNPPALSVEAAKFIIEKLTSIRAVGIDTVSIESIDQGKKEGFPVHKTLLASSGRFVVIIEDMNLYSLVNRKIEKVYVFPLRIRELDAAPVTAYAELKGSGLNI
jgi:kynurenine formamidase